MIRCTACHFPVTIGIEKDHLFWHFECSHRNPCFCSYCGDVIQDIEDSQKHICDKNIYFWWDFRTFHFEIKKIDNFDTGQKYFLF